MFSGPLLMLPSVFFREVTSQYLHLTDLDVLGGIHRHRHTLIFLTQWQRPLKPSGILLIVILLSLVMLNYLSFRFYCMIVLEWVCPTRAPLVWFIFHRRLGFPTQVLLVCPYSVCSLVTYWCFIFYQDWCDFLHDLDVISDVISWFGCDLRCDLHDLDVIYLHVLICIISDWPNYTVHLQIDRPRCLGCFFGISSTPKQLVTSSEFSLIIIVKQSIIHWFNMKNTITCDRKGLHHDLEIFHARCLGRFLVFLQHQCTMSHEMNFLF
jgi:hypothetical protein